MQRPSSCQHQPCRWPDAIGIVGHLRHAFLGEHPFEFVVAPGVAYLLLYQLPTAGRDQLYQRYGYPDLFHQLEVDPPKLVGIK